MLAMHALPPTDRDTDLLTARNEWRIACRSAFALSGGMLERQEILRSLFSTNRKLVRWRTRDIEAYVAALKAEARKD